MRHVLSLRLLPYLQVSRRHHWSHCFLCCSDNVLQTLPHYFQIWKAFLVLTFIAIY